jgi:NAD(P)-dependent dehydrogenase (short-subunit alcohol dehydrogenase family)
MRIEGMGAIVTGASRGLGAALSRELARRGARVLMVARGKDELGAIEETIRNEGGEAIAFTADIGDKRATYAIAGAAAELVGPVGLLVHNASTLGAVPLPLLLDTECETLEDVFRVNVLGPFRLTKAVAGNMLARKNGLVVQLTSDAAVAAYPQWGAYGVTKAALDHLARIWAAELEGTGVRFLSIDPGEMNTKMHADAIPDADPRTLSDPADVARNLADLIGRAEELPSGGRFDPRGRAL